MSMMHIQRGNPYSTQIELKYSDGTAYDLTDKTVFFTVKKMNDTSDSSSDATAIIKVSIAPAGHSDPVNGITTVSISAAQTLTDPNGYTIYPGQYKADVRIYQAGVTQANTETFSVEITDIVTKRIA